MTETMLIPLKNSDLSATIDAADYHLVKGVSWYVKNPANRKYAVAYDYVGRNCVLMHRLLLNTPKGVVVKHRSRDGLDNRRSNIFNTDRETVAISNPASCISTSGVRGVQWSKEKRKWKAVAKSRGKRVSSYFYDLNDAAIWIEQKRAELFWLPEA